MWRSEDEMLEVVRRQAADRRRRHRLLTATASVGVVVAVAVGAAALAGDGGQREIRVAGGVSSGGGGGGVEGVGGDPGASTTTSGPSVLAEPDPGTVATAVAPVPTTVSERGQIEPSGPSGSGPGATATTTAGSTPGSVAPSGPDTPVSSPVMPPPDGPPPSPQATRVPIKPDAVDLRPRPFESSAVAGDAAVVVRFWGGVAPCDVVGRVDVVETPDTITITLYTGREPGPEVACIAIASYQEMLVNLSSPVAGRTIVDGAA